MYIDYDPICPLCHLGHKPFGRKGAKTHPVKSLKKWELSHV